MNKKKIQALVIAGMISANTITPLAETLVNVGDASQVEVEVSSYIKAEKGHLYLSDINYESESQVGWGEIKKDNAVEGGAIKLIVDGEFVEFGKGMAAHAPSTLIYNITEHKDTYSRLMAYLGVDASRGSNGNGVYFVISTSQDGITWNEVHRTGVLKGDMESVQIDIPLNGASYIKLHANSNGNNAADHSVYGDLKLVKENYSPSSVEVEGLQSIESYDAELRAHDVDYNIQHNEMTILRRAFVSKIGYGTLKRLVAQEQKYADAVGYLLNNQTVLSLYVNGGSVNMHGSYLQSLKSFCDIYESHKDDILNPADNHFNLRLAISIALSYSRTETVSSWIKSQKGINPVHRYEVYQHLIASGKMDQEVGSNDHKQWSSAEFKALPVAMMRWAVDVRLSDDEILWMVDYALSEKAKGKNYFDAYNYIVYTMGHNFDNPAYYDSANREKYNEKYNFEEYYNDYGTPNQQRMWMVFEEGAVCGGLTQTYAVLADIFGRPSSPCGQPGHAAAVTYEWNKTNQRYEWVIQNDISGWSETGNQFDDRMLGWGNQWKNSWSTWVNASYTVLASDAVLKYEDYVKANLLVLLADSYEDNDTKKEIYEKALGQQKINLDAWERLINCYKADDSMESEDYLELAKKIIDAYNYYPQAMVELLNYIAPHVTDANDLVEFDMLKNNALLRASQATSEQSTCVGMTKQMANHYLKNNENSELATFSFDGENGGKIVLNSKYEGSQIRLEYSLDGGETWIPTDKHIIELTKDEIASINAEDDIKLSLVGTSEVFTIDILAGKTINSSSIYANDKENLLIGSEQNLANLEFSTDDGQTWCNYVGGLNGTKIEGDKTVKVRYKAYDQYLQSNEATYTFTQDTDTDERKYVPLKNVTLEDFTSQQSTGNDHAAVNFIDGNPNSAWHTAYRHEENKFYTVSFDKERYITALEYLPGNGANGRLRSGEILTSLDGVNWEVSGAFTDIGNNKDLKDLPLDNPTKTKYVKLVATETYGNSDGERNKYFSGKDIAFYEDTTIVEEPTIPETPEDAPVVPEQPEIPEGDITPEIPEVPEETPDVPEEEQPPVEEGGDNIPEVEVPQPPSVPSVPENPPMEDVKPDIPPIEDTNPNDEGWIKTNTLIEMEQLWTYTFDSENQTVILESFKSDNFQAEDEIKVEIPRVIEGYKVALSNLNSAMFPNVTQIKVAEAKDGEGQVKVLATNLMNGFANNDTLKYVSLDGLNLIDVTNMYGLFSFCKNLRVIEMTDLVIRDNTDIMAMFYAGKDYTFDERKLLVITNNERISKYNFEQSNRVPSIVTFNSNGGYFLGDTDILNMKVPRFTIHPGTLEELDKVIESDVRFAGIPTREGYEFKGWYTEDPNPTNFYELLNMTYKAIWEEVIKEETPNNTPVENDIDFINGTGGPNTPCTLKVNTELGLDKLMGWLNDKSINMSYYRLKDVIDNQDGTKTYQLHVFDKAGLVSYINIVVDGLNTVLTNILDSIVELIGIEDLNPNGQGTQEKPYEVKVNTIGGMSHLLDWLIVNCDKYHKSTTVTEEDGKLIYEVYAVLVDEAITYSNKDREIHIRVVVDKANNDVVEYINDAIATTPDDDFDNGMMVDPDTDQVVDDTPTTLPDDVPVDTDDAPVVLPDDFEVDTNKPNDSDFVEDNMGVNPDTDQVVEDVPTTLPDDVPVDTDDTSVTLPDDFEVDTNNPNDDDFVDDDMMVNPDEDQVVEDAPTTLPDDVPVEEIIQDIEVENKVDKTHVLKVNTKQGLDKVLEWLDSNMSYDRERDVIVDVDANTTTYKINVFHHDKTVSYVDIKVSSDDKELIAILEKINMVLPPVEGEMPEDDFDSDMEVNPDEDQVVENTPVVLPDDVPVEDESIPESPVFEHDVLELVGGNGQQDNPFEFIVKAVEINKFNSFLDELRLVNHKVISITEEGDYKVYKIKFNRVARSNEILVIIKVQKSNTEIINAFNDFSKESDDVTGTDKFEPVLDGITNDNIMVEPEKETSNNITINNLPNTGSAAGVGGHLLLGISSLLGGLGLIKRRNKK